MLGSPVRFRPDGCPGPTKDSVLDLDQAVAFNMLCQPVRSSSTEQYAFPRDELSPFRHQRALRVAERVAWRLRTGGLVAGRLKLTVGYADGSSTVRSRAMGEPTARTPPLARTARVLYGQLGLQRARVRSVALRASELRDAQGAAAQLTFDRAVEGVRVLEEVADRARAL
ncbi:hypothetical protein ACIQNG_34000 [Streptomyces sp. NPDC091377]|uniref:DinB/UmuC family translesion DNA polymerase n=1 Tax=Streptomyces sp. NPDC091377 TaxID=3365995 RepID=UPI00382568E7